MCQLQHTLSVLLRAEGQWQCSGGARAGGGGLGSNSQVPGAGAGGPAAGGRRAEPRRRRAECGCAAAPWSSWSGSWASPAPSGGAPADTARGPWGHGGGTGLPLGVAVPWRRGTYIRALLAGPHLRDPPPPTVWREGACVTDLQPEGIWGAGGDGRHSNHQGPHSPQGGHSPSTRTGQGSLLFSSTMPSTPENITRSPSLKRWPRFLSAPAQVTIPGLP